MVDETWCPFKEGVGNGEFIEEKKGGVYLFLVVIVIVQILYLLLLGRPSTPHFHRI